MVLIEGRVWSLCGVLSTYSCGNTIIRMMIPGGIYIMYTTENENRCYGLASELIIQWLYGFLKKNYKENRGAGFRRKF